MSNLTEALQAAMKIRGANGVALTDYSSGMCLGTAGSGRMKFDLEVAAAGNSEVVRAKMQVMKDLDIEDEIEDILISLGKEYHLIFPISGTTLFVYMALDRDQANLALARHKLREVVKTIEV